MNFEKIARWTSLAWAGGFLLAALMGFVPNPLVGDGALFQTNLAHNLVHLVTGVAFLGSRASVPFMTAFGVVYFLVGLAGFAATAGGGQGHLLGIVHINTMDSFLHLGLGLGIFGSGLILARRSRSGTPAAVAG